MACCFLLCFLALTGWAQSARKLSQVKTLYVESLGNGGEAKTVRDDLIHRLRKASTVRIVSAPGEADAILSGTARIWSIGYISLNPRSRNDLQAVLEGYLSAEIVGRNHSTLWSYLVTPSHFPWGGVPDDLARQLSARLLAAIRNGGEAEPSSSDLPEGAPVALKGAGASFPAPLYQKWFEAFRQEHPAVNVSYQSVGSTEGWAELRAGRIDFGASDFTAQGQPSPNKAFLQLPMVLGAVVPIYNLKGLHRRLNFPPAVLAGIYLGEIKNWHDAEIRKANPGANLPDAEIAVIHRSDGSGTTFVWSDYLSKVSPQWKLRAGNGETVAWPVGTAAERNDGVASAVERTPNAIGYVEFIYAIQHQLSYGAVQNAEGEFVKADIASVMAAARASAAPDEDLRASITNPPGRDSYPISTYTWLLLPQRIDDKNKQAALVELTRWMLTTGQRSCSSMGFAPLPADVVKRALQIVESQN